MVVPGLPRTATVGYGIPLWCIPPWPHGFPNGTWKPRTAPTLCRDWCWGNRQNRFYNKEVSKGRFNQVVGSYGKIGVMIKAGTITKGLYIDWKHEPTLVVEKEFFNPGKGAAVVRLKLKGLLNGNVTREVLKTDEQVEEITVENRAAQFLYQTGDQLTFMHPHSFEQFQVEKKVAAESKGYIKEGVEYQLVIYQGNVIGVVIPKRMNFKVIETEDAVKGDTVTGASKSAKLDTGIEIKVPLFIKKNEEIIVNTDTGDYVGRKN